MGDPRAVRIWIPAILFERADGSLGYETHGCFNTMVSNRKKRTDCEGDFWDCFLRGGETPEDAGLESADLIWIGVTVPFPLPKRRMRARAQIEHGSRSPVLVEREEQTLDTDEVAQKQYLYSRGFSDARAGHSPALLGGPYMRGYMAGRV